MATFSNWLEVSSTSGGSGTTDITLASTANTGGYDRFTALEASGVSNFTHLSVAQTQYAPPEDNPFYIIASDEGRVLYFDDIPGYSQEYIGSGLSYSYDKVSWSGVTSQGVRFNQRKVYFKGDMISYATLNFSPSVDIAVGGNILSLQGNPDYSKNPNFYGFFKGIGRPIDASMLTWGDTDIKFNSMFYWANLSCPPELPPITLTDGCYNDMFYVCTNLSTIRIHSELKPGDTEKISNMLGETAASGTAYITSTSTITDEEFLEATNAPSGWTVQRF